MSNYKFLTVAGMDYDIDPEDNEPDTLLALNNFEVNESEFNDPETFKAICSDQIIILGLNRFMNIGDYIFKDTSVVTVAEKLKNGESVETEIIEFDKEPILVGSDIEHAERKRAIIPITTKIKIAFEQTPFGLYKLNVFEWTNDNDEDREFELKPLFWISLLSI